MKIGDIVQQGDRIIKMKGRAPSKQLGVVVEMTVQDFPAKLKGWEKLLGESTVTVLWESGKLTENMAENSLEVITRPEPEE